MKRRYIGGAVRNPPRNRTVGLDRVGVVAPAARGSVELLAPGPPLSGSAFQPSDASYFRGAPAARFRRATRSGSQSLPPAPARCAIMWRPMMMEKRA